MSPFSVRTPFFVALFGTLLLSAVVNDSVSTLLGASGAFFECTCGVRRWLVWLYLATGVLAISYWL